MLALYHKEGKGVKMAIVLYARKSVERENSISCDTQLEYCKSMLRPDERDEKIISIVDNGFSGGNVNRDGFQKMMKLIRQGTVGKVIVYKLDRISRSLSDFVNILQEFKEYGVEFLSSQESFDTSSPYGEMLVKLLMVFAEFERTSIISRVTQAYAHRSEMGFYMGGRQPYGFLLAPTMIHSVKTKKLEPSPGEAEQVRYIFENYAQENISLRQLLKILLAEGKEPLNGSSWTTAKLSAMLKNPIYVKADADVYDYYDRHGAQITADLSLFTGKYGAQLYGHTKHDPESPDWSDMKLVLLSHPGLVDSHIWLKCQRKLEKNRQIGNSFSNRTSWLAGKVVCEKCGHTMTTVKGRPNKNGQARRYFNCTGKTHKRTCTGPKVTIYAEDLENMVYDCILEKLADLKDVGPTVKKADCPEVNALKLQIKAIEKLEHKLVDALLTSPFNDALLSLANQRSAQLKKEKQALYDRLKDWKSREDQTGAVANLAKSWRSVDYNRKKAVAGIMIHKIVFAQDGGVKILWNI